MGPKSLSSSCSSFRSCGTYSACSRGKYSCMNRRGSAPGPMQRSVLQPARLRSVSVSASSRPAADEHSDHALDKYLPRWLQSVPRVRMRPASERPFQQLAELAVLNERLQGRRPWEARKKLEYFQKSRATWKAVCQQVLASDAIATLEKIEEAQRKVDEALSQEFRDGNSVTEMRMELQHLQEELELAHKTLHETQHLVNYHEKEVEKLQQEAESLRRLASIEIPEPSEPTLGRRDLADPARAEASASAPPRSTAEEPRRRQRGGAKDMLRSSLDIEEGLKDYWFPVEFSKNVTGDKLIPFEVFNEMYVLFRDETGAASCVLDECAHRGCPLSLGSVEDGRVQCPYHGWEYDGRGQCTKMPSTAFCKGIGVRALETVEKDGLVWVWAGSCEPFREIPDVGAPPAGHEVHSELVLEVPVEHGLLVENLLDLAHAPFTHTSTFARGWPVPDAVKFRMMSMLGGEWDPYPIEMKFEPPCITLSTIGLQQPGQLERGARAADCDKHLRQMHVCLPARNGHTRLLYRMSLDFMPFLKKLPFMDAVWREMANRVLGEDLVLVKGQQERLHRGGDTWGNPVSYDKLAVRYRRWRNSLSHGSEEERRAAAAQLSKGMTAGELFSIDEAEREVFVDRRGASR
uniref:Chlorophyllide a oxygenase n=1 Tax=Tetraselmis sp. GSL018 TaxID=582737 RepID=A0A061RD87_9CHLO